MDEIFLRDYVNNIAQAQEPFGLAAVQSQPGFENYTPSFQPVEPNQQLGLVEDQPTDYKKIVQEGLLNLGKNYAMDKMGLDGLKRNVVGSLIGASPLDLTNPVGLAMMGYSALNGNSLNISNFLAQKRAEKNYALNQKKILADLNRSTTKAINENIKNTPPSKGDRNRGQIISQPEKMAPTQQRQERHTAGPGGLHSGY